MINKVIGKKKALELLKQGNTMEWLSMPCCKAVIRVGKDSMGTGGITYTVRYPDYLEMTSRNATPQLTKVRTAGLNTIYGLPAK